MPTNFERVIEFHNAFGVHVESQPTELDEDRLALRLKLIKEEFREWRDAVVFGTLTEQAKELADLLYVVYGTAAEYGFDIDAVFAEVHRSNMSKLGADGRPIYREDGKVLKGPNYEPADIAGVFEKQAYPEHRGSNG